MSQISPLPDPHSTAKFHQYWVGVAGADVPLSELVSPKKPCRGLMVGSPGILVVLCCDDVARQVVTYSSDVYLPMQVQAILSSAEIDEETVTSTAHSITVYW